MFWSRDLCLSSENICHGFLILHRMRMTSECKYIMLQLIYENLSKITAKINFL